MHNTHSSGKDRHTGTDEYSGHLAQSGSNTIAESQITLNDFNVLKVIGRGSYAKVLMVRVNTPTLQTTPTNIPPSTNSTH